MTGLDVFALIVLLTLLASAIAAWIILGILPGRIAVSRHHPQAEAINICGWVGALTMGILSPVAYIWAYTKPIVRPIDLELPRADAEVDTAKEGQK